MTCSIGVAPVKCTQNGRDAGNDASSNITETKKHL